MNALKKLKGSFHLYAAVTILFWSTAFVFTRLALQVFSALNIGFLRYLVASLVLIAIAVIKKIKPPKRRDWPLFLLTGACGITLYMPFFNIGTSYVSAATSSVMISTAPVFSALFAFILFHEKLFLHQWIAIVIEFFGIVVLNVHGGVFTLNKGVIILFIAAVVFSFFNLLQQSLNNRYASLQTTIYSIVAGTLPLAVFAPSSAKEVAASSAGAIFILIWLGVIPSAIAYILWGKAFEKAEKVSQVSNYMFFSPVITSMMGIFIAGEIPDLSTVTGGVIIILGTVLFNRGNALKALVFSRGRHDENGD